MYHPTRRSFLKTSAALTAGSLFRRRALAAEAASQPLAQFRYSEVQLLDGPMRAQFDANHAFFLAIDEDKLLKPYRKRAGLPTPGEDMGGWYDDFEGYNNDLGIGHGFAPGHSFGQYISGLSRAYAITGSTPTHAKVHRLVRAYSATVSDKFYTDFRFPAYTYDKMVCGLIDAHEFAADPEAFSILDHTTNAAQPHLPEKALSRAEMYARPHKNDSFCWDESYTLPENQFLAYSRGAGSRYRDLGAKYLEDDTWFNPLAAGDNPMPGEHAYSHVNSLSSAMQAYLVLGSEKHLRAAKNAFNLLDAQSFASGGWGPDEALRAPDSGAVGDSLDKTHNSFETPCGAYAHFKITRYLLRVTRDSRYGDSMERVLYNTILGAKPLLEDGSSFYYSDYNRSAHKVYHQDKWPCCSGTFPQITADYGISSYLRDLHGIYVNLYVPSRITWQQGGTRCSVTQQTSYPAATHTQLDVTAEKPERFSIFLRIPAWAGAKSSVSLNGTRMPLEIHPGTFAELDRTWKRGDRIELELDMPMRLESVDPQHANLVALMRGPVALFGTGTLPPRITRAQLLAATPAAISPSDWQVTTNSGFLLLKPFTAIQNESYRLYQPVIS